MIDRIGNVVYHFGYMISFMYITYTSLQLFGIDSEKVYKSVFHLIYCFGPFLIGYAIRYVLNGRKDII